MSIIVYSRGVGCQSLVKFGNVVIVSLPNSYDVGGNADLVFSPENNLLIRNLKNYIILRITFLEFILLYF